MKLDIVFREGKEYNGWFEHEGRRICRITIPKGRKPLTTGTFASMARQLCLTARDLDALIDCPLGRAEYLGVLRARGRLV